MAEITARNYSITARRAVTQVAVSKLIDIHGHYVSSAVKTTASQWLAELTKMKTTDYFDPKTCTGFLNKDVLNRRRHLSDSEKRWVWSKKIRVLQEEGSGSDNPTASATIVNQLYQILLQTHLRS